jgi:formylglycine-generating enzyme required for sulfatase activity
MLKYILTLLALCTITQAQTEIIIHKTNNSQDRFKIVDIDSITFSTTPLSFYISSVTPSSGKVGDEITIKGKGFGDIKGTSYAEFNSKASLVYNKWTDTEIKCIVPTGATTGILLVLVNGKPTNGVEFKIDTVAKPSTDISPNKGFINTIVNIRGKGFGNKQGNGYIQFNTTKATNYFFWQDTLIACYVPTGATTGNVKVFTDKEETISINSFTVQTKQSVKQTVFGRVIDENKIGIKDADVTLHGKTTKTDEFGGFLFENADVPNDRLFAVVKKNGYFETTKAGTPNDSGVVQLQLLMPSRKLAATVQSNSSSTININDNAKVILSANSIKKSDGSNYTGVVKVYAQYYSPNSDTFAEVFPGDALGMATNGQDAYLYSYGFMNVELEGSNGEKLNLKTGTTAELQSPSNELDKDTIPLWYYDMTIGKWKEEGFAFKNGNLLRGKVTHFTTWNIDKNLPPAIISGQVTSCEDNQKIEGVIIQVGQITTITDKNGRFRVEFPNGGDNVLVKSIFSNETITIPSLESGKEDIVNFKTKIRSFVVGRITDCNNKLQEKMVYALWGTNGFTSNYAKNGLFKLTLPIKTDITLQVGKQKQSTKTLDSCEVKDLGIIKECDTTKGLIDMVSIPSGTFRMGNIPNAQPVRTVTISKSFLISKYEVTQKLWKQIYGTNPSNFKGDNNLPIENITWLEAAQFCNDLSLAEGFIPCYEISQSTVRFIASNNGYRLPTEAEWEYAARAGTKTDFYQGNADEINIDSISWNPTNSISKTHPVGLKQPNGLGLYDLHGNVSEFILDYTNSSNGSIPNYVVSDIIDPGLIDFSAGTGNLVFVRGGSFFQGQGILSTHARGITSIVSKSSYFGFRVVRNK